MSNPNLQITRTVLTRLAQLYPDDPYVMLAPLSPGGLVNRIIEEVERLRKIEAAAKVWAALSRKQFEQQDEIVWVPEAILNGKGPKVKL